MGSVLTLPPALASARHSPCLSLCRDPGSSGMELGSQGAPYTPGEEPGARQEKPGQSSQGWHFSQARTTPAPQKAPLPLAALGNLYCRRKPQ